MAAVLVGMLGFVREVTTALSTKKKEDEGGRIRDDQLTDLDLDKFPIENAVGVPAGDSDSDILAPAFIHCHDPGEAFHLSGLHFVIGKIGIVVTPPPLGFGMFD